MKTGMEHRAMETMWQRKQITPRLTRYFATEPPPTLHLALETDSLEDGAFRVSADIEHRPLPPLPPSSRCVSPTLGQFVSSQNDSQSEQHGCQPSSNEQPMVEETIMQGDAGVDDHHSTDDLDKRGATNLYQDKLTGDGLLNEATVSTLTTTLASSHLDCYRFPARKSPIELAPLIGSRLHRHGHHQSMPQSSMHPVLLSNGSDTNSPSNPERSPDICLCCTSTSTTTSLSEQRTETDHTSTQVCSKKGSNVMPDITHRDHQDADAGLKRRRGQQRLRRSESCSMITHRHSLSFNSSKNALLSLQARRINKRDAKVHRLPDIQTTTTLSTTSPRFKELSRSNKVEEVTISELKSSKPSSSTSECHILHSSITDKTSAVESPQDITDYQMQVSDEDRDAIDTILTELTTTKAYKTDPTQRQTTSTGPGESQTDTLELRTEAADNPESEDIGPSTITANKGPQPGLTVELDAYNIDPNSAIDPGEIKRFEKRSHVLRELESTEESYVQDLDVLMHVSNLHDHARGWLKACKQEEAQNDRQAPLSVYRNLAESFELLNHDNNMYSTFCELRMRSVNEINRSWNQTTMTLLQKESKELMAHQGRPASRADLKDYLIKPIQRICRYPLLLKEILRLTSLDDPEYQYLEQAHELMKGMAQEMDEAQRTVERKLLTEQFLRKLPETNFPRRISLTPSKEYPANSNNNSSSNSNSNNGSGSGSGTTIGGAHGVDHHGKLCNPNLGSQHYLPSAARSTQAPYFATDSYSDFGPISEGIASGPLTKAFSGTLGSIVLAGALEYVIIPDMPIRLKYYGCFLFEKMLIIVKAKKSSLYEPRQWLPLRLCELHETTRLDGYTRFGWRIMFDQFRIDLGASNEAEQQVWVKTLQYRIQAAKDAYAKLPRDIAAFETIVSSLPWNMNKLQGPGYTSTRHQKIFQQSPSPSPSPWSACSSAIPSPLMPPPPHSASSSSTMMMAMSPMVIHEPEKWNAAGSGLVLNGVANNIHLPSKDVSEPHSAVKHSEIAKNSSMEGRDGHRVGGMVSSGSQDATYHEQEPGQRHSHPFPQARWSLEQQQQRPQQRHESPSHHLHPLTPVPWLLTENRPKSHSFDVTRVFTSNSSGRIKANQRSLVQSMFKDVSTENIWTTSTASQPSPQSTSILSPLMPRSASRHGTASSFNLFSPLSASDTGCTNVSNTLPVASETLGSITIAKMDEDPVMTTAATHSTSALSLSLTNRFLRRRDSGKADRSLQHGNGPSQEKTEGDRRRNSATAAIASTLAINFRKSTDSFHRIAPQRRPSIHEPSPVDGPGCGSTPEGLDSHHHSGIYQWISVKARAQMIERRFSAGQAKIPSGTRGSPSISLRNRAGFKIRPSQSHQNLGSATLSGICGKFADATFGTDYDHNCETISTLNSAAEAARSRRGNGERISWRSVALSGYSPVQSVSSQSLPAALTSYELVSKQSFDNPFLSDPQTEDMRTKMNETGIVKDNEHRADASETPSYSLHQSQSSSWEPHSQDGQALTTRDERQGNDMDASGQELHPGQHHPTMTDTSRQRSLTSASRSTIQSCASSPLVSYSNHYRTASSGTEESMGSDKCYERVMTLTQPRLSMTNSVSSYCSSISSGGSNTLSVYDQLQANVQAQAHMNNPHPYRCQSTPSLVQSGDDDDNDNDNDNAKSLDIYGYDTDVNAAIARMLSFDDHLLRERRAGMKPRSSIPSTNCSKDRQERRMTLTILHNITHSATQKFKTLIRSPNKLRRRTVLHLTPITMENALSPDITTHEGEGGVERDEAESDDDNLTKCSEE
ncbi:hypothetical protein BG011_003884 [Mortierella polycephala]|uniref:DH domain-containing protein n=1 Tax=Mortierella polycephala TaxID=41804 RepID=A0A9P6Q197_9FUNG|nr:hypothetical protein BG011_003884 [Mortierella polycephala]